MTQDRFKAVLLFGAPGAGKGTQGRILGAIPGFFHLSCGDVFRTIDIHSDVGRVVYEYSSRGALVPDDVTLELWRQTLHAHTVLTNYKPHDDVLVLDGIPRNVEQARLLDEDTQVLRIVHLMCSDKEKMVERLRRRALKENRVDDAREDVIQRRWEVYESETWPVLAHYPSRIIAEVDAARSPAAVLEEVLRVLVPVQEKHFRSVDS